VGDSLNESKKIIFSEKEKILNYIDYLKCQIDFIQRSMFHLEILCIPMIATIISILFILKPNFDLQNLIVLEGFILIISLLNGAFIIIKKPIIKLFFFINLILFPIILFVGLYIFNLLVLIMVILEFFLLSFLIAVFVIIIFIQFPILKRYQDILADIILDEFESSDEIKEEIEITLESI
jgi:hypothetical protein